MIVERKEQPEWLKYSSTGQSDSDALCNEMPIVFRAGFGHYFKELTVLRAKLHASYLNVGRRYRFALRYWLLPLWGVDSHIIKLKMTMLFFYMLLNILLFNKKIQKTYMNIEIRAIRENEIGKLEEMLYEAIYQPDEENPIPKSVLKTPEVYVYIKDFGKRTDDYCLVSDLNGEMIGAVWARILSGKIKGYGNVDHETPELAIALFKQYRHQGIGTRLMARMIDYLRTSGYKQTSLSVQKENYAVKLYKQLGFDVISENKEDYLMLLKLNE